MIIKKPYPLLEASFFLANRAAGRLSRAYFEEKLSTDNPANEKTREYAELVFKLEERLEAGITVDEAVIDRLFKPYSSSSDGRAVNTDFAANLVVQSICNYFDTEDCFPSLHESGAAVINRTIANWLHETNDAYDPIERAIDGTELFDIVNGSILPAEAKLLILDLAMHYDKYVDMLEAAVLPVAKVFSESGDLTEPLMKLYREAFPDDMDLTEYRRGVLDENRTKMDDVNVFPLITYFPHRLVAFSGTGDNKIANIGVGVLYHYFIENYANGLDDREKLSVYMSIIGGKNRFNILTHLADGPIYGRELARMLDVTPATVSQHMSLLMSAGLVSLDNEGSKVYYSLNREGMEELIRLQRRVFLDE